MADNGHDCESLESGPQHGELERHAQNLIDGIQSFISRRGHYRMNLARIKSSLAEGKRWIEADSVRRLDVGGQ